MRDDVEAEPGNAEPIARARVWRWEGAPSSHRYGRHARTERRRWLVEVSDRAGRTGWGEAAPLPGFGGEGGDVCAAALVGVAHELVGRALPLAPVPLAEWTRALGLSRFARAAVECAAADLAARVLARPLARWLGASDRPAVAVAALAGDLADDEVHARVARWSERGVRTVKLKVLAGEWPAQHARLRAVRAAHPALALRLDANGEWSPAEWCARSDALGELAIEFVEQPFAPSMCSELAAAARGGPAIAVDETLAADPTTVERLLALDLGIQYVLKPAVLGVLGAWSFAERIGHRPAMASHFADGPIGRASARVLAQVLADRAPARAHGVAPEVDAPCVIEDGRLFAPAGAGLAVEPDLRGWVLETR